MWLLGRKLVAGCQFTNPEAERDNRIFVTVCTLCTNCTVKGRYVLLQKFSRDKERQIVKSFCVMRILFLAENLRKVVRHVPIPIVPSSLDLIQAPFRTEVEVKSSRSWPCFTLSAWSKA